MVSRKEIQNKLLEIYEEATSIYEEMWSMNKSELRKVYKDIDRKLENLKEEVRKLYDSIITTYTPERYPRTYMALRGFFLNVLFDEKLLKGRKFWKYDFPVRGELPKPRRRILYSRHPFIGRTVYEVMRFIIYFIDAIESDKHSWIELDILRIRVSRPNVTYYFYVRKNWNKVLRVKHVPAEYEPRVGRREENYAYASILRSIAFLGTSGLRISTADFPSHWIPAPETKYGRRLKYDFSSIDVEETVIDDERRFVLDFSNIVWLPEELNLAEIRRIFEERGEEVEWVSEWWE